MGRRLHHLPPGGGSGNKNGGHIYTGTGDLRRQRDKLRRSFGFCFKLLVSWYGKHSFYILLAMLKDMKSERVYAYVLFVIECCTASNDLAGN